MQWYETIKARINYNEWSTFKDQLQQYFANKFTLPEQGAQTSIISESTTQLNNDEQLQTILEKMTINEWLEKQIDKIPVYHTKMNATTWLRQLIENFSKLQLNNSQKLFYTSELLSPEVYLWFVQKKSKLPDFSTFCEEFLLQYDTTLSKTRNDLGTSISTERAPVETVTYLKGCSPEIRKAFIQDIIKNPKVFHGAKENVVTWLEQVEQQFTLAEWSNETKLKYVSNQLKGDALVWFNELKDMFTSWSEFVEVITKAYTSPYKHDLAFTRLEH
ncbi:unnamed protein product [Didymodactylos carnosus]|nr:unnamed protein product [Didymodactylos carnosus]CAF3813908.1 unnamed protein product [Didymodactylos carnosus]